MPRIAVVGDVMLDAYFHCAVAGFSPEDDLAPKLAVRSKTYRPGGAANVACCLNRWGAAVGLFGVAGNDFPCETLIQLLRKEELERVYIPSLPRRVTTCKTRVVTAKLRQVVRVDEELAAPLPKLTAEALAEGIESFHPDAIVVSDYAKGVITGDTMGHLHGLAPVLVVDPKRPDFRFYGPVFAITPNMGEYEAYYGGHGGCSALHLIVTRGASGALVMSEPNYAPEFEVPVRPRSIGDPAGCGDAFLAGLVFALCNGETLRSACLTASAAGALAFDMLGVACPTLEQVGKELECAEYRNVREFKHGQS